MRTILFPDTDPVNVESLRAAYVYLTAGGDPATYPHQRPMQRVQLWLTTNHGALRVLRRNQ